MENDKMLTSGRLDLEVDDEPSRVCGRGIPHFEGDRPARECVYAGAERPEFEG